MRRAGSIEGRLQVEACTKSIAANNGVVATLGGT
jgi:hypothetical protein